MSRKRENTCLTCLDFTGCMKQDLKPSEDICSTKRPDRRLIALQEIRDKLVKKGGSASLRRRVKTDSDWLGVNIPITIYRVRIEPGTNPECLVYNVGDDTTTEQLDTRTLERIAQEI